MNAEEEGGRTPGACLRPADAGWAVLIGVAALLLYGATLQERLYGHDGVFLVNHFLGETEGHSNSALYASAAAAAGALVPAEADPIAPLKWLSALGGAFGVAATFLLARATGAPARGALLGTLLFALAPAQWFFSTAIETHALHVGAVGLVVLVTVFAPWGRPPLALALVALAFPLLFLTHMTALFVVPGWFFLARFARARRGQPVPPLARDALVLGPLFLAGLAFAVACANYLFGAGFRLFAAEESPGRFLDQFASRFTLDMFWGGWLLPLFLLPCAAAVSVAGRRLARPAEVALLWLVVPAILVLLWASIPERGAYFLGSATFLAALAAHAPLPTGGRGWALVALAAAAQGIAGLGEVRRHDELFSLRERVEAVRSTLGEEGVLITINPSAPKTKGFLPGVFDYDASEKLFELHAGGQSPQEFAAFVEGEVRKVFPQRAVALDMSYRHLYEPPPSPELVAALEPYMAALEDRLQAGFRTTYHPHPSWPVLVLER